MTRSNIRAAIDKDIKLVWDIVTSLDNYLWRSDLSTIEVLEPEKIFIEHTKDDYSTTFTITAFEPMKRYEFDMENENMKGHWVGLFSYVNGQTIIDFTEDVHIKKLLLKPFAKAYLKRQQAAYVNDLKRYLEEVN